MKNVDIKVIKEELISAYHNKRILEFIQENYLNDRVEENLIAKALIELHNEHYVDVIALFNHSGEETENVDFYIISEFFGKIILNLDASVIDIITCINYFSLEENIGVSYNLLESLRQFCRQDYLRIKELYEFSISNINANIKYLKIAFLEGLCISESEYLDYLVQLLNSENETIKSELIFILGNIIYKTESNLNIIWQTIKKISKDSFSDELLAAGMHTIFSIYKQSSSFEIHFLNFLEEHIYYVGNKSISEALRILLFEQDKLTADIEKILLLVCECIKSADKEVIRLLDSVLKSFIVNGKYDKSITFLEKFFENNEYNISMTCFDTFIREIHNYKDIYLSNLLTRWFLSNNYQLQRCAYDLFYEFDSIKEFHIKFDNSLFDKKYINICLFLAKKSIGWFFYKPNIAISLIESVIVKASEQEIIDIKSLIFDYLFISYPDYINNYFEKLSKLDRKEDSKLKNIACCLLSEFYIYQDEIKKVYEFKDLEINNYDKFLFRKFLQKQFDRAKEKTEEQSILSLFCHKRVLLYGNEAIYVHTIDKQNSRRVIPVKSYNYPLNIPRLSYFNPCILNMTLSNFRKENI
ncbi:hypothetical protein [Gallibacterium salpingitidis]|uniref:Uncharacterized protein n=1 Tax=Gallibacterium salpingitidis TaxID=505341 RepID=A0A1A7P013_9PAST|nr:hypothetical protein [Gallibacterium salpingitidis]OBW95303.1 hypothetical protein QS62_04080 [Gallibacterium salpingitidis]